MRKSAAVNASFRMPIFQDILPMPKLPAARRLL